MFTWKPDVIVRGGARPVWEMVEEWTFEDEPTHLDGLPFVEALTDACDDDIVVVAASENCG